MFDSMEDRVRRLELYTEAQRLIGLYSSYMSLKEFDRIPALFALGSENLRAEMLWGVYDGDAGIQRLYNGLFPALAAAEGPASEELQGMEVPIIQVAKDCLTVKGVWVCPGYLTVTGADGKNRAYWSWQKCACDFLVVGGELKIWHLHIYGLFESLYGTTDVQSSGSVKYAGTIPDAFAPDRPPTTRFDLSTESIYPYAPAVPRAYTVFDQDFAY